MLCLFPKSSMSIMNRLPVAAISGVTKPRSRKSSHPEMLMPLLSLSRLTTVRNSWNKGCSSSTSGTSLATPLIFGTWREIGERRGEITSAMVPVLQRYFQIRGQQVTPNPIPNFEEHFTALCDLLRAYGDVAEKPADWAELIITLWDEEISGRDIEEDSLEYPIMEVLQRGFHGYKPEPVNFKGKSGSLWVSEAGRLLIELKGLGMRDLDLPKNAQGFSRRLKSIRFRSLQILDAESAPELEQLRRKADCRPLGIFRPDDEVTIADKVA